MEDKIEIDLRRLLKLSVLILKGQVKSLWIHMMCMKKMITMVKVKEVCRY